MVKKIILAVLALIVALFCWQILFPSEEAKIRRQFKELASQVDKQEGESAMIMALKVKKIQENIAPECEVNLAERNIQQTLHHGEISRAIMAFRRPFTTLEAQLHDLTVHIQQDTAEVETTIIISGSRKDQEMVSESRLIQLSLKKGEEMWQITAITLAPMLER